MNYLFAILILSYGYFLFNKPENFSEEKNIFRNISAIHVQHNADILQQQIKKHTRLLTENFGAKITDTVVLADIASQQMYLVSNNKILKTYIVSTAKAGSGSQKNSNKTPLGVHRIKNKIGHNAPLGTIFFARVASQQIAQIYTDTTDTPKDYVTTRIMWLDGLEKGKNKGGNVDSYERYIYIHGTHEEGLIGKPMSMGCIRMKNADVIEFFDMVKEGTLVYILPNM